MSWVEPEVVERMVALVREIARKAPHTFPEAVALSALLPEPIDPDLIEARKLIAKTQHDWPDSPWHQEEVRALIAGERDRTLVMMGTLAGIKRGRELAANPLSVSGRRDEEGSNPETIDERS